MGLSVSVMLIVLGVVSLLGFLNRLPPTHETPPLANLDRTLQRSAFYARLRPSIVGIVHGLAGSATLILFIIGIIPGSGSDVILTPTCEAP